jgi:hypothetical protein
VRAPFGVFRFAAAADWPVEEQDSPARGLGMNWPPPYCTPLTGECMPPAGARVRWFAERLRPFEVCGLVEFACVVEEPDPPAGGLGVNWPPR